jgi:tetratricopeptide (TPR) repeat protein
MPKQALRKYRLATNLSSDDTAAWRRRGETAALARLYDEAETAFCRLTELDPDSGEAWRSRASALRKLERYEEACAASANAVRLDGTSASWLERAECLTETVSDAGLGAEDAIRAATTAYILDVNEGNRPKERLVKSCLIVGVMQMRLNKHEEALDAFETALGHDSRTFEAWLGKGYALAGLNRNDEAIEAFRHAKRLAQGSSPSNVPRSPVAAVRSALSPIVNEFWTERRKVLVPTLAYAGGLVVWSINAHRNELGAQATLDVGYLIAGIVPGLIVFGLFALVLFLVAAPPFVSEWMADRSLAQLGASLVIVLAVIYWFGYLIAGAGAGLPLYFFIAASAVLFVVPFFTSPSGAVGRAIWLVLVATAAVVASVYVFAFYAEGVYPRLPQALGGGLPRCARLDVDTTTLSQQTLEGLLPAATSDGSPQETEDAATPKIRSVPVDILFSRDDVLFVRPRSEDDQQVAGNTHELRGGTVRAVISC